MTILWLTLKALQWICWISAIPFWFGLVSLAIIGAWAHEKAAEIDERYWKRI